MVVEKPSNWFTLVVLAALLAGCSTASTLETDTPAPPTAVTSGSLAGEEATLTHELPSQVCCATPS
jgi:uncharacterized lipoprotein YajG